MSSNGSEDYWIYRRKGLYDGWRHVPFSTQYPAKPTAVTKDVLEWGLIYAFIIIGVSFFVILPGFRKSERITAIVRIFVALFVLAGILLSNFGQEWEVSQLTTKTPYRAFLHGEINATIEVKIALRSVNITLKTNPPVVMFEKDRVNETIDYNERFSWDNEGWTVGRFGFGPNAGKFNQEFREHQRKGSPFPILWIAEYFTIDGEGIRWGRHYLQAGYFTHIMIWTAFALWILTLILFNMVLVYGGYFSLLTGVSMIIGNIIYATYRNPNQIVIPFEDGSLKFHWGWCFWLSLATGILCTIIGIIVIVLDETAPEKLADFFGVDFAQGFDEIYYDPKEIEAIRRSRATPTIIPPPDSPGTSRYQVELMEQQHPPQPTITERAYRKRSMFGTKTITPRPRPPPIPVTQTTTLEEDDAGEDYENAPKPRPSPRPPPRR